MPATTTCAPRPAPRRPRRWPVNRARPAARSRSWSPSPCCPTCDVLRGVPAAGGRRPDRAAAGAAHWTRFTEDAVRLRPGLAKGKYDAYLLMPRGVRDEEFHTAVCELLSDWGSTVAQPEVESVRDGSPTSTTALTARDPRLPRPDGHAAPGTTPPTARSAGRCSRRPAGQPHPARASSRGPAQSVESGARRRDPDLRAARRHRGRHGGRSRRSSAPVRPGSPPPVYGASEGLSTVVLESEAVGGQAGTSSMIRNYLGFPRGISGMRLAQRARNQAHPVRHPLLHRLAGHLARARARRRTARRTHRGGRRARPRRRGRLRRAPTASSGRPASRTSSASGVYYGSRDERRP